MDPKYLETMEILLRQVVAGQNRLADKVDEQRKETSERLDHLDECVDGFKFELNKLATELKQTRIDNTRELIALNAKIESGFPNADVAGHRIAHEGLMREAQRRAEYKGSVVKKLLEWAAVGVVVLVTTAVWQYFTGSLLGVTS